MNETGEHADTAFWRGLTWVVVAYFTAFITALLALKLWPALDPFQATMQANLIATVTIFAFSFAFNNTSMYDAYWSVTPILIVGGWTVFLGEGGDPLRQGAVLALVSFWGVRLTANWLRTWPGLHHQDWRYVDLQRKTGPIYWPVSLLALHVFPTLVVAAGLWPVWRAITSPAPFGALDAGAVAFTLAAILLEAVSDAQLHAWRARNPPADSYIDEGFWRWSRHPNYLGELGLWWGLWLVAMAADPWNAPTVAGALAMTAMFRFASIPMMEARNLAKRPSYREKLRSTGMLLPFGGRLRD